MLLILIWYPIDCYSYLFCINLLKTYRFRLIGRQINLVPKLIRAFHKDTGIADQNKRFIAYWLGVCCNLQLVSVETMQNNKIRIFSDVTLNIYLPFALLAIDLSTNYLFFSHLVLQVRTV
jgi:hypothetical protein